MRLGIGTFAIGPSTGALTLETGRSGLGAAAGHDLVIEVTRWRGTVHVDEDRIEASTVEVVVDASSLEVREGRGGAVPLLGVNKAEILRTIKRVLQTEEHPEMRFASTSVEPTGDGYVVRGDLTIAGITRPVELAVAAGVDAEGPRGTVTATILHTDFGITPYSAMFGVLKVRDAVGVRAEVRLPRL